MVMLNVLTWKQKKNLVKQINELPKYKTEFTFHLLMLKPNINDEPLDIEKWDARIRTLQNIIINIQYLRDKVR